MGQPRFRISTVAITCAAELLVLGSPSGFCHSTLQSASPSATTSLRKSVGQEVAVPVHLQDGHEFSLPLEKLLAHGKLIFNANWTEQEGGGRPLTKGTGRPVSDPSRPLTGHRAFNRMS